MKLWLLTVARVGVARPVVVRVSRIRSLQVSARVQSLSQSGTSIFGLPKLRLGKVPQPRHTKAPQHWQGSRVFLKIITEHALGFQASCET